ncbi:MFS transporter [Photobacterium halotolerans]|uniref:MFS transporter n=1 Tax=Photobacterium halotolerans TaxID=265726 RepID=A0A0F5VJF6_9GAMM|nr:MFS transporter [Photobacterium halotolerans]KKD01610.1 hypothetical protein KY46_02055 [Photobacterium halotolerans]
MNSTLLKTYLLLAFSVFLDMSIQIVMIWKILEITSSTVYMGMIVSIGAVTPFILSKIIQKKDIFYKKSTITTLRAVFFACMATVLYFDATGMIYIIFMIAVFSSCNMVCSINTFEVKNSSFVKSKLIEASKASRVLQTTIQFGAFFGALFGGWYLKAMGFENFIYYIAVMSILLSVSYLFVSDVDKEEAVAEKSDQQALSGKRERFIIQVTLSVLTGLHIGAFNTFVPVYYQLFREWGPDILGFASGLAGIGALCAALLPQNKHVYLLSAVLLLVGDIGLFFMDMPYLSVLFCFCIGYAVNSVRITSRTEILKSDADQSDVNNAISHSNYLFYIVSGTIPMLVTMGLTYFSFSSQAYGVSLILVGVFSAVVILLLTRTKKTVTLEGAYEK